MDSFFTIGKRFVSILAIILLVSVSLITYANITTSGITTFLCPIPPNIPVAPIVISESQVNDFAVTNFSGDYRSMLLTFDGANFSIDITGSTVNYNAPDFAVIPVVTVNGAGTLVFRFIVNTTTALDAFTVSGITVSPLKPAVSVNLTRHPDFNIGFNSQTIAGSSSITYATFTSYPKANVTQSTATICSGLPLNLALTSTLPGTKYTWTAASGNPNISGFANNPFLDTDINDVLTNSGTTSGTVVYTVAPTATTTGCAGDVKSVTVTVRPYNNFNGVSSGSTCDNGTPLIKLLSSIPGTLFNFTMSYSAGVSSNTANPYTQNAVSSITGITFYNSSGSPKFVDFDITPLGSGCTVSSSSFTLTVNPNPTFAGGSASVCSGNTLNYNFISSPPGATFTWVASANTGSPTGFSSSSLPGISSISQALSVGAAYGQVLYNATPRLNGCIGSPAGLYVDVNPGTSITTPSTATVCSGFGPNLALTLSTGTPTGWGWTVSSTGTVTGFSAGTGFSINQTLNGAGVVSYIVTASGVSGGCGTPIKQIDVTVLGKPVVTSAPTYTICSGLNTNISLNSSPSGGNFDWTSSLTSGVITGQADGSGNSISQILTNSNLTNGSVSYLVTLTANGCVGNPSLLRVTVKQNPTVTTLATASICGGTNVSSVLGLSNNLGVGTYRWSSNVVSGTANSPGNATSPNSGPLSDIVTVGNGSTARILYGITATVNGCSSALATSTITAYGAPSVTLASPPTFCFGSTVSIPGTGITGLGISGYSWSRNANDGNGFVDITNGNKNNLDGSKVDYSNFNTPTLNIATSISNQTISLNAFLYRIKVDGFCGTTTTTSVLNQGSGTQVDIYTFKSSYCSGDARDVIKAYPASGSGQWIISPPTTGVSAIGNNLTINPAFVPINQSFTTTYTIGGGICVTSLSNTAVVGASPIVSISRTPTVASFLTTDSPVTFTGSPIFGGTGVFSGNGVIGNRFFPDLVSPGRYGITYTFSKSPSGCSSSATDSVLVVDASSSINFQGSPSNTNFCIYDNRSFPIVYNGPSGTKSFGVYTNPFFAIDEGIQGLGITQPLSQLSPYTISGSYTFTPSLVGNPGSNRFDVISSRLLNLVYSGLPTGSEFRYQYSAYIFKVNIVDRPIIPSIISSKNQYCPGDPIQSFTSTGSNLDWYYPTTTTTSDKKAANVNTVNAATLFGTNTPTPGIYTFYVSQGITDANCRSLFSSYTVTVNGFPPAPAVSLVEPAVKCAGQASNYTLSAAGIPNTLSWYTDPSLTNLAVSSSSTYLPSVFSSGSFAIATTISFYATQTLNGCQSPGGQINVQILPTPAGPTLFASNNYCTSDAIKPITVTSTNLTSTFKWYNSSSTVGANFLGSGLTQTIGGTALYNSYQPLAVPTNLSTQLDTSFYATVTQNGCESAASKLGFTVFVRPQKLTVLADTQSCIKPDDFPINIPNGQPKAFYKWYNSSFTFINSFTTSGINASQILLNKNSAAININYVTQTLNNCESAFARYTLTVFGSTSVPGIVTPPDYCVGDLVKTLTASGQNIVWYDNSDNPLVSGSVFTPVVNSLVPGNTTFKASQTINDCQSIKTTVTIVVNPKPNPPVVSNVIACDGQRGFPSLVSSGSSQLIKWFNDSQLTQLLLANSTTASAQQLNVSSSLGLAFPTTTTVSIYVTDSLNKCNSNPTVVQMVLYPIPPKPVIRPQKQGGSDAVTSQSFTYCVGQAIPDRVVDASNIAFQGAIYNWYTVPGLGAMPVKINSSTYSPSFVSTSTGNTTYLYVTQTLNTCESQGAIDTIIVSDFPSKPFASPSKIYCENQSIDPLTAVGTNIRWYNGASSSVKNGISAGNGLLYNSNIPNTNGYQTRDFYVTQTIKNCQSPYDSINLTVYATPIISLNGLSTKYCVSDPTVTLSGTTNSPNGILTFTGPGVVGNTFNASVAGLALSVGRDQSADNVITFIYTTTTNCTNRVSQSTKIVGLPNAQFYGLKTAYCKEAAASPFPIAFVAGGSFIMDNVQSFSSPYPTINILKANANHTIKYIRTESLNNCKDSTSQVFRLDSLPVVNFNLSTLCLGDTILFSSTSSDVNTLVSKSLVSYNWNIAGNIYTATNVKHYFNPSDASLQSFSLTVTTDGLACVNSATKSITLGAYPNPGFSYSKLCKGDTTMFINRSTLNGSGTITGFAWDFGNSDLISGPSNGTFGSLNGGSTLGNFRNPKKIYAIYGSYFVKLSATTDKNCTASITNKVNILPKITPGPGLPYIQNFNSNISSGFVSDGQNSSWQFGIPAKTNINLVATGEKAWYTGKDSSYNEKENSWVECPCFDFTYMTKPMVSMDIKRRFDNLGNDGATLLYNDGTDTTWSQVGGFDNLGMNWYDAPNLNSSQPGDRAGLKSKGITYPSWNKNQDSLTWTSSRYILDNLAGKKSVRFRVAFGSIASSKTKDLEGFAFKSFAVKERSKVVLLEHFTNSSKPSQGATDIVTLTDNQTVFEINKLNKQSSAVNVLPIFYHTNFPGKDSLNALNQADPSSRTLYYGISSIPRSVLDGNFFNGPGFTQPGGLTSDKIIQRSLLDPAFGIDFDVTTTSGNVTTTAIIKALTTLPSGFYSFQMSAIENILSVPGIVGGNGQKAFYYTHRKFLPDAAGTTYNKSWAKGETVNLTQTWTYTNSDKPFNPSQIGVVGFIQNIQTKEVYQVGYRVPGLAANITEISEGTSSSTLEDLSLYPNPANDELTLLLDGMQKSDRNWVIYDALGLPVVQGIIPASYGTATISTNHLSSGWYLLVLQPENGKKGITKKLVIQH